MSLDLYNFNLITILLSILLMLLCYQSFHFLKNKSLNKVNRTFLISRFVGVFIILILFIHPVFRIYNQDKQSNSISIYIDNSKSMLNNISINELEQILTNIEKWGLQNDFLINWYSVSDSVRKLDNNNIDLSHEVTNLDMFRDHVINDIQLSHYVLITDGLNYLGQNQKYNFGKSINVFGIGESSYTDLPSIEKARIFEQDGSKLIHFYLKNATDDEVSVNLYQQESNLSSHNVRLEEMNDGYRLGFIKIDSLNLTAYDNLKIGLEGKFKEAEKINIFNDMTFFKPILLISGTLSLNTKYIKGQLMKIGNLEHSYLINSEWNNGDMLDNWDDYSLIVFDNYPSKGSEMNFFQSLVAKLNDLEIPLLMAFGPNQDYEIIEKISDFFTFKVRDFSNSDGKKLKSNTYYKYPIEEFYPTYTPYIIDTGLSDKRNIFYDDLSLAASYEGDNLLFFYTDIANIAYKDKEFHLNRFDDFINHIFSNMYYGISKVKLFSDKSDFYNNEDIELKILNNSGIDFKKSHILVSNELNETKWGLENNQDYLKRRIINPGNYRIQLIENGQGVSNILNISIKDYLDESKLFGQDVSFLSRIARESGGDYINTTNYLDKIGSFEKNINSMIGENKYDSKDFLFILFASILLLSIDWFYRKKNGLL